MEQIPAFQMDRRDGEDRRRLNEPVMLKVFAGVLVALIASAVLWLSAVASSSVVTSQRFTADSARRDFRDSMRSRDLQDMRSSVARTDTNVYRLCVMLSPASRRGECR